MTNVKTPSARLLGNRLAAQVAAILLALIATGCTHHATSPSGPDTSMPVGPKPDTIVITPIAGEGLVGTSTVFKLKLLSGAYPTHYQVQWSMDSTVVVRQDHDSLSWSFSSSGIHSVAAALEDTSGKRLAFSRTIYRDTVILDSTSHDFTWQMFSNVMGQDDMTGCWVFGPNDILAVNWDLYRYDGTGWVQETLAGHASGALSGSSLFGFSHADFWILSQSIMYHWDGTTIQETRLEQTGIWHYPHDGIIHSAWGTSSSDMYFVGDSGTILHFDGSLWTKMKSNTSVDLTSIWGTSSSDIWACGYPSNNHTALLHYDGSSKSVDPISSLPTAQTGGFASVWCTDSSGHKIAFAGNDYVFVKRDDGPWRNLDSGKVPNYNNGFYELGLRGNRSNDLFAASAWGLIIHYNGHSWMRYDQFFPDATNLPGGGSFHGNTVCIVGQERGTSYVLIGQRK